MQQNNLALICILISSSVSHALAQDFLVLEKMGTKKRYEYYSGEEIIFKLKSEEFFRTDVILAVGDSALYFKSGKVPLNTIGKISLSNKKMFLKATGSTLVVAGVGYMLIDLFNKTIRNGEIYFDSKVARSGSTIAGTGAFMIAVGNKKVNLKNNWRLRIVSIQ